MAMTSYERMHETVSHHEPDRVPVDIGGMTVSSISSILLRELLVRAGIDEEFASPDPIQRIGTPPVSFVKRYGIDTVRVGPKRIQEPEGLKPWERPDRQVSLADQWGVSWVMHPGDHYFSQTSFPLGGGDLADRLDAYEFPLPDRDEISRQAAASLDTIGTRFPIFDRDCAGFFEMSQRLRGMEEIMTDLYLDRASVERLADRLLEYKLAYWDIMLEHAGDRVIAVAEADDYGTAQSLLISPDMVRKIYLKRLKVLVTHIKKRAPRAKLCFHSCGAIRPIIPDFIEAGIDMINPVQYHAAGMDLAGLKHDFGSDLVFWGGCVDTTQVLPYGTPDQVKDEVKRVLDIMAPGGGFVAATVHNLQADVPAANALALLETLQEYGNYR